MEFFTYVVGNVYVWDVNSGEVRLCKSFETEPHKHDSWSVGFTEDGNSIEITLHVQEDPLGEEDELEEDDVATYPIPKSKGDGQPATILPSPVRDLYPLECPSSFPSLPPTGCKESPDGRLLAYWEEGVGITVSRKASGVPLFASTGHADVVRAVSFSPSGRLLASGGDDRVIRIWDVRTGGEILHLLGHQGRVESLTFSPDGKRIVSCSVDKTARLWDTYTGSLEATLLHDGAVRRAEFAPDGLTILTGRYQQATLWDIRTKNKIADYRADVQQAEWILFRHANVPTVLVRDQYLLHLYDVRTGALIQQFQIEQKEGYIRNLEMACISSDGRILVASICCELRHQQLAWWLHSWDLTSCQPLCTWGRGLSQITAVKFTPRGAVAVSNCADTGIKFWDPSSGNYEEMSRLPSHDHVPYALAYSPTGEWLASGGQDTSILIRDNRW